MSSQAKSAREQILGRLLARRISAILRCNDRETARDAMKAAVAGGITVVEFTLSIPGVFGLIEEFAADPGLVVGAGTVMAPEETRRAVAAGARFIVSPALDAEVVTETQRLGAVSIPGTYTATEMLAAVRAGADMVKLFPAPPDVAGYVAALLGPMPYLKIFPTSGVTPENFVSVLRAGASGVGFVKSLFEPADLAVRDWKAIERRARAIVESLAQASGIEFKGDTPDKLS